jgi:hypothetical protein
MATKFKPLTIDLIDEGEFLNELNADLHKLQGKLVEFMQKHKANAKNALGVLTIKVKMKCIDPDNGMFSVKAATQIQQPNRPPSETLAMAEENDAGEPALFVRNTGSSKAPPQQGKLTTNRGEVIDPDTGEVKATTR